MINIAIADDLHRLLRQMVENGHFPNEEAVVEEALRLFLFEKPGNGQSPTGFTTEPSKDDDAHPSRGIDVLDFPEEVLFTKQIDIRTEQLDEWRPQGVTSERRARNEDE